MKLKVLYFQKLILIKLKPNLCHKLKLKFMCHKNIPMLFSNFLTTVHYEGSSEKISLTKKFLHFENVSLYFYLKIKTNKFRVSLRSNDVIKRVI